jgi:hypothetical protein
MHAPLTLRFQAGQLLALRTALVTPVRWATITAPSCRTRGVSETPSSRGIASSDRAIIVVGTQGIVRRVGTSRPRVACIRRTGYPVVTETVIRGEDTPGRRIACVRCARDVVVAGNGAGTADADPRRGTQTEVSLHRACIAVIGTGSETVRIGDANGRRGACLTNTIQPRLRGPRRPSAVRWKNDPQGTQHSQCCGE